MVIQSNQHDRYRNLIVPAAIATVMLISALIGLLGCSSAPVIQYVPQRVEVPVVQKPPAVTVPPAPRLAIQDVSDQSTDAQMMASWVASVQQLKADDLRLRALLEPYQK